MVCIKPGSGADLGKLFNLMAFISFPTVCVNNSISNTVGRIY